MDVWLAVTSAETADESILGVYTTEELALITANRVSPQTAEVRHCVLDEVPGWIDRFEQEFSD
jgi:hypothetical protein